MLVKAILGDRESLRQLAEAPKALAVERLQPAIAIRARRLEIAEAATANWGRVLVLAAANTLLLRSALDETAGVLAGAGVPWVLLKGPDLGSRVYDEPEERPTSDLDLLVPADRYRAGRGALEAAGFRSLAPGALVDRFVEEEGYCWQARSPSGALLELHFRLWGMAPRGFEVEMVSRSEPGDGLPPGGRRLPLALAFVVAAVHLWLDPPPRPFLAIWDLERIAVHAAGDFEDQVVACVGRWDLQLPVVLAALYAGELWGESRCRLIGERLWSELRAPERWLAARALRRGALQTPLAHLVAARLLARRRSRSGWRAVSRRVWAHPGVVARATPSSWSWPRRRWAHVMRSLSGLGPRAEAAPVPDDASPRGSSVSEVSKE